MGLFSKIIPERKWTHVAATLYGNCKDARNTWYTLFCQHVSSMSVGLTKNQLTPEIESAIASLQWAVVGTTVRENGYVKLNDFTYFIELLYIAITGRKADEMVNSLGVKLLQCDDPKRAMDEWGNTMVPLVSDSLTNPKLAEILSQWSSAIILQTKILTCEACYDHKGAEQIRKA